MTRPKATPEQAAEQLHQNREIYGYGSELWKAASAIVAHFGQYGSAQNADKALQLLPRLLRAVRSYLDASGAAGLTAPELRTDGPYSMRLCLLCGVDCEPSDCAAAGIAAGRVSECPDPCGCFVAAGQTCEHCGRKA